MPQHPNLRVPDGLGHFGPYGGMYVPETLMAALQELDATYRAARRDKSFRTELDCYLREYMGYLRLSRFTESAYKPC